MLLVSSSPVLTARKAFVWGVWPAFWACVLVGMAIVGCPWDYIGLTAVAMALWLASVYLLGGIKRVVGFTVLFMGIQHLGFAHFMKTVMGQRADIPLYDPIKTMQVYCLAFAGILAAALVWRYSPIKKIPPVVSKEDRLPQLRILAIGLLCAHVGRYALVPVFRELLTSEFITPLAVAAGTAYAIKKSNGRRLFNTYNIIAVLIPMAAGIVMAQRREAGLALATVFVTAFAFQFKWRFSHVLLGLGVALFFQLIVFPYALVARNITDRGSFIDRLEQSSRLFTDALANPDKYQEEANEYNPREYYEIRHFFYYGERRATFERFSVNLTTDAIIRGADQLGPTGWKTITWGFEMIPHRVFYEDKPYVGSSNWIARRAAGLLNSTDLGTSITMGWPAEAYSSFKWSGMLWIPFAVTMLYILVFGVLVDDRLGGNIFAVMTLAMFPWTFSEGPIQENVVNALQAGPLAIFFCIFAVILANSLSPRWTLRKSGAKPTVDAVQL